MYRGTIDGNGIQWSQPRDSRTPRRRIACRKGIREHIVDRTLRSESLRRDGLREREECGCHRAARFECRSDVKHYSCSFLGCWSSQVSQSSADVAGGCADERANDRRPGALVRAAPRPDRCGRSASSAGPGPRAASWPCCADASACERRKRSSLARAPNASSASAQSVRASTCGHSSLHASLVLPERSRRSWATMASCHAARRMDNDVASLVPIPELNIAYGFIETSW